MESNRKEALESLKKHLEPNILNHSIALEACMVGLYDYFRLNNLLDANEPGKDDWAAAGLLHDVDYSGEFKDGHPAHTKEALDKYGLAVNNTVMHIIKAHAPALTGTKLETKADWSIFCADSLTGLIVAVALILPSKKLADVKLSSVMKRFLHQPKFAAGTRRNEVAQCENPEGLNLPLAKFVEICLESMEKAASEIGL
jgi:predicted hydrolase (HD superfamily)